MKLKTGDKVRIISGRDKGKEGKISQVFPKLGSVVIDGVNIRKKHLRGNSNKKGQIVEFPAPVHSSNVQIVGNKISGRIGYKNIETDGITKKVRLVRKAGNTEDID
jgi:large subunit ribosomal protein L24